MYLIVITIHMFISRSASQDSRFNRFLRFFEFGMFIRLGQVLIMPFTYFAMRELRVVAFDSTTKVFDYLLAFLYSILLPGFVGFSVYIINYAEINLEAPKTIMRYGSFYTHVKYQRESKVITNEFCFRLMLKMLVAVIHSFSYFNSLAVCITAISGYGGFLLYILITLSFNGMYKDLFLTFKMSMFHLVILINYIFAAFQVGNTSYELSVTSFLVQMINSIMILYLIIAVVYNLIRHIQKLRKEDQADYDENDQTVNLNVVSC